MKKHLFVGLILLCLFISCNKDTEDVFGNIFGILVNESGNKLASSTVFLFQNDTVLATDTTNEVGEFNFEQISAGTYHLYAFNNTLKASDTIDFKVKGGIDNEVLFVFKANLSLTGILVDFFGEILASKLIILTKLDDADFFESTTTNYLGKFSFYDLEPGFYNVYYLTPVGRKINTNLRIDEDATRTVVLSLGKAGTFVDARDNKVYKWVKIGNQTWMAENLAYLPKVDQVTDGSEDVGHSAGKYYYVYNFLPDAADVEELQIQKAKQTDNYKNFGVLYSWPAAMNESAASGNNPSGVQGACPDGWHLPSVSEYNDLSNYVSNDTYGTPAGKLLKSTGNTSLGTGLWYSYGYDGIDEYKMTLVPAGYRDFSSFFGDLSFNNYLWTTNQASSTYGYFYYLGYYTNSMNYTYSYKGYGFSVRCVKDVSEK